MSFKNLGLPGPMAHEEMPRPIDVLDNLVNHYQARIAKLEGTLLGIKAALQETGGFEHTISLIDLAIIEEGTPR